MPLQITGECGLGGSRGCVCVTNGCQPYSAKWFHTLKVANGLCLLDNRRRPWRLDDRDGCLADSLPTPRKVHSEPSNSQRRNGTVVGLDLNGCGSARRSLGFDFERPASRSLEVNSAREELAQPVRTLCDLAQRSVSRRGRVPALWRGALKTASHNHGPRPPVWIRRVRRRLRS